MIRKNLTRCFTLDFQYNSGGSRIVSMNFVRSEWCCYEFKAAHHEAIKERKGNILLVLLEELDEKQLDADIKMYIKTHTYLETKHPQFTERLILALPKPCGRRNSIGLD